MSEPRALPPEARREPHEGSVVSGASLRTPLQESEHAAAQVVESLKTLWRNAKANPRPHRSVVVAAARAVAVITLEDAKQEGGVLRRISYRIGGDAVIDLAGEFAANAFDHVFGTDRDA